MENNTIDPTKPSTPTSSQPPRGVMDIQPRPHAQQPVGGAPVLDDSADDAHLFDHTPPHAPFGVGGQPAAPPQHDVHPSAIAHASHTQPLHSESVHPDDVHPLLAAHAQKRGVPHVVIGIAIFIGLALIGLAIYMYMQTVEDTHNTGDHPTPTSSTETPAATTTDVDNTAKEVDSAISASDDAADLPESDLTDQALGL